MVDWSSIPIGYKIYHNVKKYFDLKEKEKVLIDKEEQLKNQEQELSYLRKIGEENSRNYESKIEFIQREGSIRAEDYIPSPYLQFSFSISNFSIFDFKTKRIAMNVYHDYELGSIEITEEMEVPHQEFRNNSAKLQLHPNFIKSLKLLKKEDKVKSIKIRLRDVKIDFTGYKEFRKYWGSTIELEIPMENIHVTL